MGHRRQEDVLTFVEKLAHLDRTVVPAVRLCCPSAAAAVDKDTATCILHIHVRRCLQAALHVPSRLLASLQHLELGVNGPGLWCGMQWALLSAQLPQLVSMRLYGSPT